MDKIKQRITNKIYHKSVKSISDAAIVESCLKSLNLPVHKFAKFVALHDRRCILTGDLPMILCLMSGKITYFREHYTEKIVNNQSVITAHCMMKRVNIEGQFYNEYSELDASHHSIDLKEYYLKYKRKVLRWQARELTIMQGFGDIVSGGIGQPELMAEDIKPTIEELSEINMARKKIHESIMNDENPRSGADKFEISS